MKLFDLRLKYNFWSSKSIPKKLKKPTSTILNCEIISNLFLCTYLWHSYLSRFYTLKRCRALADLRINVMMNSDVFYESKYFHVYCSTVYEDGAFYTLVKNHLLPNCDMIFIWRMFVFCAYDMGGWPTINTNNNNNNNNKRV